MYVHCPTWIFKKLTRPLLTEHPCCCRILFCCMLLSSYVLNAHWSSNSPIAIGITKIYLTKNGECLLFYSSFFTFFNFSLFWWIFGEFPQKNSRVVAVHIVLLASLLMLVLLLASLNYFWHPCCCGPPSAVVAVMFLLFLLLLASFHAVAGCFWWCPYCVGGPVVVSFL